MKKDAYFQVVPSGKRTMLKVYPASDGGAMFTVDEVQRYLDSVNISGYNLAELNNYLRSGRFDVDYLLVMSECYPEGEKCLIDISEDAGEAVARFYPPSPDGKPMDKDDILSDLRVAGVVYGIQEAEIDRFLKERRYCTDYYVAKADQPVPGKDASIEYFFDVNVSAKPKLNEDGSVDFHHLGNIKQIEAGQRLAKLTPAYLGEPGTTVTGQVMQPNKVKNLSLRFGRNIRLSEDKCEIFSEVAGHVTLVDDLVMVSDVYDVPANVDLSTGDIEYNGTVHVNGNVLTGYQIHATGDIIVNGVVEGAELYAGGNIVLKRGMQGMSKGRLDAAGNISAKFIENSKVRGDGTLMCDAVLHSNVECRGDVSVLGRKGLINGGHVCSYSNITATQTGSLMGTLTVIEILSDVERAKEYTDLNKRLDMAERGIRKMDRVLGGIKASLKAGIRLNETQVTYLKMASFLRPKMQYAIETMENRIPMLESAMSLQGKGKIIVNGNVNPGTKIVIKEMSRMISDTETHCKFILEGADIKAVGL